ncbi:MAG: aminopeptidase [Chloroflexota bacterium]
MGFVDPPDRKAPARSNMTDPRTENLAKILVNHSIQVKPGDWVFILFNTAALPLARETLRNVLRAGGHANLILEDDDMREITLSESSDEQLDWISPVETVVYDKVNAAINLRAATNSHTLTNIAPEKQRRLQMARRHLMQTYLQRSAAGDLRWVVTNYPCYALAQDADMSLREYEDFVYAATFADQADPVAAWQQFQHRQQRLIDWLAGKKQVVLRGPNVDLKLSIAERTFVNCSGQTNMPDGEIFTGPVEDSANGWVRFTYPAIFSGREVEDVELELKDGKVVNARARKNEEYLLKLLDSDPGARYLGEFAIGTNYGIQRFTKNILFDEKIGGSFHMAVGAGYPETGSKNQSSIHWDFICDMRNDSEILVDGELFYKNGDFTLS